MRALAAGGAVVLALALGELGLRLLPEPPQAPKLDQETRQTALRTPHFRGPRPRPEKAPETFRVMFLGDSFTWGWGVDWDVTFAARLARWLPQLDSERRFEVVNWSRPGWNSWREWLSVRDELAEWDPDLLILAYVLNDAEPTAADEIRQVRAALARRTPGGALSSFLYRRSRLTRRGFDAFENRRLRRELVAYYHGLYEADGWRRSKRALKLLRQATAALDVPMLLVLFPIFDSDLDDDYAYRDLHAQVAAAARELDIPYFDLLPTYEGIDGRELAAVPFVDPHPSPHAHWLAATAILERLLADGLLPATMPDDEDLNAARPQASAS